MLLLIILTGQINTDYPVKILEKNVYPLLCVKIGGNKCGFEIVKNSMLSDSHLAGHTTRESK